MSLFPLSIFVSASASDNISELRFLLEQSIQLSALSKHGDFAFQTEFAHFPNLDLFLLSTKSHISAPSRGFTTLAGTGSS